MTIVGNKPVGLRRDNYGRSSRGLRGLCEDVPVRSQVRQVAKVPIEGFARLTGIRGGGHVPKFVAEDARAFASYLANPAARRAEKADVLGANTIDECFDFSRTYFGVGPVQHRSEITALLRLAQDNGTQTVCEIGAQDAGSSVMFSRALNPDTLIVMDLYTKNRWRLRNAAPGHQGVHTIDGDTTHPLTVKRLRRKLQGRSLDLLLIDGDHRWAGVRHDFLTYREFVRDGGLIAFHDICAVRSDTTRWAGDVPAFWQLVRPLYESHEFLDSRDQQGLGIGVLRYDPACSIMPVLSATAPA